MTNIYVHIVEDDHDQASYVAVLLQKAGITNYKIFVEPEEFLKSGENIDICILDYRFANSGLTGLEITEELLERNRWCRVIIVTVAPDMDKFWKVFNAGAWKYLNKNDEGFRTDLVKYVKMAISMTTEEIIFKNKKHKQD